MTTQPAAGSAPQPQETPGSAPAAPTGTLLPHQIRRTRVGGLWVAAASFALVLLLLLIFILQNSRLVSISYFGGHGHVPLGVALLLAAVLGVLLVVIPGTGRIVQLRRIARRHRRLDTDPAAQEVVTGPAADLGPTVSE
jgi:lipopolysaccharide assembly protein A